MRGARKHIDGPFLTVFLSLLVFGLLIFTSAALGLLARDGGATFQSVAVTQLLLGFFCGGIALIVLSRIDYRIFRPYTPYFLGLALLLTLLTFVPGIGLELKGASRWISVGPVTFQPAELLKFASVLFLASVYAANYKKVGTWMGGVAPFAAVGGLCAGLLLLQPDTDGAVVLLLACGAVLFAAGARLWHLLVLALCGIAIIGVVALQRPYLVDRFTSYLNPTADPQGSGWQLQQSLIAVGSGGWTGRGFGQSIEKFAYLPEPIGDSIFAVAAEEFGFVGSVLLVLMYAGVALLGLRIAARAPDPFGGLIVVGLVMLIIGQSFMNIASTLGLIPLSGLPLIFVSHGGTALAISLAEVGVILSVSRRMKS
jgi:cell division protein FtsW